MAARAALAVPGVAELQPGLGQRLAGAATWVRRAVGAPSPSSPSSQGGVRADRVPGSAGWRLDVRCVLDRDRRALDVARDVRDQVRAAVVSHVSGDGSPEPVEVVVTVTRIIGPPPPDADAPAP
ncbi:hypothetical protein [Actinacidiphila acidipaludis]|uniref:hypothetical protein n=1 Tax=Actinacidiphila acidipaludis TaxID=2873382 RepID=UPI0027E0E69D|nr:hypothetical protein [Streptomyces acidipaludis]